MGEVVSGEHEVLPAASKLTEMIEESINKREGEREGLIGDIAAAMHRKTSRGSQADLLVQFEETRCYRSAVAVQAAKTRRERGAAATETTTPEGWKVPTSFSGIRGPGWRVVGLNHSELIISS